MSTAPSCEQVLYVFDVLCVCYMCLMDCKVNVVRARCVLKAQLNSDSDLDLEALMERGREFHTSEATFLKDLSTLALRRVVGTTRSRAGFPPEKNRHPHFSA